MCVGLSGKTALVDTTLHLDPDLAKHRLGRDIMQRLEDTFGVLGVEGPAIEISERLPMWPLRSATWTRKVYTAASNPNAGGFEDSQQLTQQTEDNECIGRQAIPYQMLFFSVSHRL